MTDKKAPSRDLTGSGRNTDDKGSAEVRSALDIARELAKAGVAIFVAPWALDNYTREWNPKGGTGGTGYWLPTGWQDTEPDPAVVDTWRPGMALCAVMGSPGPLDALDYDPQNGGSREALEDALLGDMPVVYGRAQSPSGGTHEFIAATGLTKAVPVAEGIKGVDHVAGQADGKGRLFVFLAPTKKKSKADGKIKAYRWIEEPDLTGIDGDASTTPLKNLRRSTSRAATERSEVRKPYDGTPASPEHREAAERLLGLFLDDIAVADVGERHATLIGPGLCALMMAGFEKTGALDNARERIEQAMEDAGWDMNSKSHKSTLDDAWKAKPTLPDLVDETTIEEAFAELVDGAEDVPVVAQGGGVPPTTPQAAECSSAAPAHPVPKFEPAFKPPTSLPDFKIGGGLLTKKLQEVYALAEARRLFEEAQRDAGVLVAPVSLADLIDEPDEETPWLLEGVWPVAGRVMVAAQHKIGKTTLVTNVAKSLADGGVFLGRFSAKKVERVVLIDNEMSRQKLKHWLRDMGITNTGAVEVISLRGCLGSFDLTNPEKRSEWAGLIGSADVLIFDCLRPALDALGLSEDKDAGRFLTLLSELCGEAGIESLMVIHHMGHKNERARGDSAILGWPDANWKLVREDVDDEGSARYFSAYGRDVDVAEGRLDYDRGSRMLALVGGGRGVDKAKRRDEQRFEEKSVAAGKRKAVVLSVFEQARDDGLVAEGRAAAVAKGDGLSKNVAALHAGGNRNLVMAAIEELLEEGLIEQRDRLLFRSDECPQ